MFEVKLHHYTPSARAARMQSASAASALSRFREVYYAFPFTLVAMYHRLPNASFTAPTRSP